MTIHKTKDSAFKLIFDEPELFAEFLREYVPVDILKDITASDIEDLTERFIPLFQDSKDSDTVKKVNLRENPPLFVVAILEHESGVNHRASFKMLQYITLVLNEYEKEANKENPNASVAKDFKYPPVLPIVFYDGSGKWTAETNFFNKTEQKDVFRKYIPNFEYELVNLNDYDEQELIRIGGALSLVMLIDKIKSADGLRALNRLPQEYIDSLELPPHLNKLIADVITVLLKRINVPDNEIDEVTKQIYEREVKELFAWADNYDVQETRRAAKTEGFAEGLAEGEVIGGEKGEKKKSLEIAKNLLKKNIPVNDISEVTGLTREEIEAC